MLRVLFFLLLTFSLSSQKLMNLERCYDPYNKKFLKNCCILTDTFGFSVYLTEAECQLFYGVNSAKVCQAIGDFNISTLLSTDYIVAKGANSCKLVKISDIVSPSNLCYAFGQLPKLNYNRGDMFLMQRPNGTCYKDSINWALYGGLDCPGVIDCISGNPLFCEEVENCLTDGALCTAINNIPNGTYVRGDKLIFEHANGDCYQDSIRWDQYGGLDCEGVIDCISTNPDFCDEVKNCINSTYICQTLNGFGGMNFIPQYLIGINNGQCAKVDGNLFGSAAICSNLNLLGYSGAVDTVFGTYNGQCYKVALPSGGSNFNCDSVQNCFGQQWFCDSVTNCLNGFLCDSIKACLSTFLCDSIVACIDGFLCDSIISCIQNDTTICDLFLECLDNPRFDTLVCEALHSFPFQEASSTGDTVIAVNGGICYKTVLNTGGGDWNCDSTTNCVNQFLCDSILACVGNVYCDILKGLDNLPFEGNGSHKLFFTDGGACYSSSLEAQGANCISAGLANGVITVGLNIDPIGGITCGANGIKVDLCPFFAGLPNGNPYTGQPLIGADCKTYTVNTNITCANLQSVFTGSPTDLTNTDLIMVNSGGACEYRTLGTFVVQDIICNLGPGSIGKVLCKSDGGPCGWLPCDQICGVPDLNPRLLNMASRLDALEKENKELRKLIKEIQNKIK